MKKKFRKGVKVERSEATNEAVESEDIENSESDRVCQDIEENRSEPKEARKGVIVEGVESNKAGQEVEVKRSEPQEAHEDAIVTRSKSKEAGKSVETKPSKPNESRKGVIVKRPKTNESGQGIKVATVVIRSMGEIAITGDMSPDLTGDAAAQAGYLDCQMTSTCDSTAASRDLRRSYSEAGEETLSPLPGVRSTFFPTIKRSLSEAPWLEPRRRCKSNSSTSSDSVLYFPEFTRPSPTHQVVHGLNPGSLSPIKYVSLEPPRAHGFHSPDKMTTRSSGDSHDEVPQDLSKHQRTLTPDNYPVELQLNLRSRGQGVVQGVMERVELREREVGENQQGPRDRGRKKNEKGTTKGLKRELEEDPASGLPEVNNGKILGESLDLISFTVPGNCKEGWKSNGPLV
ncbi:hypothetical protein Hamer_G021231 [Homarus americanus]|uniref:Uncharacterized protein n=1 Tax=Homarus americanus TaxID=6706 RepID=A0A8J5JN16_HOMAM|nr:hypothetical protein Hamer_G021231 [Homarus americanus]